MECGAPDPTVTSRPSHERCAARPPTCPATDCPQATTVQHRRPRVPKTPSGFQSCGVRESGQPGGASTPVASGGASRPSDEP
eukprot:5800751-Alexandrium_andersonii.AAC.1